MAFAQIAATGRYVPERVITNSELEAVDLVLVATDTPDQLSPSTASVVQAKLGAPHAAAFDLNCACAGWVTALDVASRMIQTESRYRNVLVIGVYGMSRFVDWTDKKTCTLFADGAGAVLLQRGEEPGVLAGRLAADGRYHDALGVYAGGTARPATAEEVSAHGAPHVEFVKKFPATFNTDRWPELIRDVLGTQGMTPGDASFFVFTQLNLRTIEATMERLGLPMTRTHWTMDKWGYTGSGCIPMTLDDAVEAGKIHTGDHVVLCATGGGLAMGCVLVKWTGGEHVDR
jgi:3-oxoacyl-[acyl-carrier-protein] synthase-3